MPLDYRADKSRFAILAVVYGVLTAILLVRMAILQLYQYNEYHQKSLNNLKAVLYEPAFRGQIYDRNGLLLSNNTRHFDLYYEAGTEKSIKKILDSLATLWGDSFKKAVWQRVKGQPLFEPLLLKRDLSVEELAEITPWLSDDPKLVIKERLLRGYPFGESCAHLIGYTQPEKFFKYHSPQITSERPITGLEVQYDAQLKGYPSKILISKNAQNHQISKQRLAQSHPGENLTLTINALWQQRAYDLFEGQGLSGSLVVIDVRTGEILVSISAPSFHPEKIRYEPEIYHHDRQRPLFNRALQGLYPPASLIKPVIAIAALEEGFITPETCIDDPGYYQPQGSTQFFHDWKKKGHGRVTVQKALVESCDTFFYILGDSLGIDTLSQWFYHFGLAESFNHLPLKIGRGIVPTKSWKQQQYQTPWYRGDSIQAAIGQGYLSATPLHLAYATALIASRGQTPLPQILKNTPAIRPDCIAKLRDVQCWDLIHHSMEQVIDAPHGTAHKIARFNCDIAGKTGTAQVVSHQTQHRSEKQYHDHSLFMAYAPRKEPKIACVVVIEHHGGATLLAADFLTAIMPEVLSMP